MGESVKWTVQMGLSGRSFPRLFGYALLVVLTAAPMALAQEHAGLIRMLSDGTDFRVRTRAAMALGSSADPSVAYALEAALLDGHPGVRAAAAAALGRLGQPRSVPALRVAANDPAAAVREQVKTSLRLIALRTRGASPATHSVIDDAVPVRVGAAELRGARFVVVLGEMRNHSGFQGTDFSNLLGSRVADELRQLPRVAVLSSAQLDSSLHDEIRRSQLPTFRIEGSLTKVLRSANVGDGTYSVRAEVSLLLLDERERALRSMLRGAATGTEPQHGMRGVQERQLARKALQGAVRSAMANASTAMEGAAKRGGMREGPATAALEPERHRPAR